MDKQIWMNGEQIAWDQGNVHLMSHALHYGSSVFEGIRAYQTPHGTAIFRLEEHIERLFYSARVYRIPVAYSFEALVAACKETVRVNGLKEAYIRPLIMRGAGSFGLYAGKDSPVDVAVIAVVWNNFLGEQVRETGIRACVTSWNRLAPNTMPAGVKAGGNYLSSQLISHEAHDRGYDEGIGLTHDGLLSEGAGENLFFVKRGRLYTPPASASILGGITRDTVMTLARERDMEVVEQALPREFMYAADEMFMTGTAAEITPVVSVDDLSIGNGQRGPVTAELQDGFFAIFNEHSERYTHWLDYVEEPTHVRAIAV